MAENPHVRRSMNSDESSHVPRWFTTAPLPGPRDSPPPSDNVEIDFGARSRRGPGRFASEDHYLILRLGRLQETLMTNLPADSTPQRFAEFGYGMVVADGMGSDGEPASRLAITTLAHLTVSFGKWNLRVDEPIAEEIMDRAERFYRAVGSTLLHAGRYSQYGLQSTLTAVYTAGNELFFAHSGDSRAYLCRDGTLLQLTRDHATGGEHLGGRTIVEGAANLCDLAHAATETIERTGASGPSGPRIDVERFGLLDGDTVLLCTNGLTNMVDDAGITGVLRLPRTSDDQCRMLVDLAVEAGAKDDVTVLVAHYRIPG